MLLLGAEHKVAIELASMLSRSSFSCRRIALPNLAESIDAELLAEIGSSAPDAVFFAPEVPTQRLSFRRRLHLVESVKKLCQVIPRRNIPVVHLSSALVYNGRLGRAYTEQDKPSPASDLAKVWRRWETLVQNQFKSHIIIRTAWLLGRDHGYLPSEIQQGIGYHAAPDKVVAARSNPVSPAELARVVYAILLQTDAGARNFGVFHVGGKEVISSKLLLEKLAPDSYLTIDDSGEELNFEVDCRKVRNSFGIQRRPW